MRKPVIAVVVLAVVGAVFSLSAKRHSAMKQQEGVYSGTIEAEESRIGSTAGGRIIKTLVSEGDFVSDGQVVVYLQPDQLSANLNMALAAQRAAEDRLHDLQAGPRQQEVGQARAMVRQAQAILDKLRHGSRPEEIAAAEAALNQAKERYALVKAGPRKEEIDRARASLEDAQASYKLAQGDLARIQKLENDGAVSKQALDQSQTVASNGQARVEAAQQVLNELLAGSRPEEIRAARQAVKQAEAGYALVKKGPREEDIEAAEAAVEQAKQALANLQAGSRENQIAQAESAVKQAKSQVELARANAREQVVYSPASGQILSINVRPGDIVAAGQPVAVLADPKRLFIRIYVSAQALGNMTVGTKLNVVTDSGTSVNGTVEQIPVEAEFTPRNVQTPEERALQEYAVKIRIPNPDLKLRAGMSAQIKLGPVK